MEYRVEEIARAAGVGVDTVRFYQSRGLLPAPRRRGRVAIYGEAHLERLRRIRELSQRGLTLAGVRRVIEGSGQDGAAADLLGALAEAEGERTYPPAELAATAGVSETFLEVMRGTALLEPVEVEGEPRYTETDLQSVRAARELLDAGVPLDALVALARDHAAHVREITGRAIEVFDRHVRRAGMPGALSQSQVSDAFRRLLPATTQLVALHFQRSLIEGVRARLAPEGGPLAEALDATERARLRVTWS